MKRTDLIRHISKKYDCKPDYPWTRYPDYAVFRHANNHKWFCLLMNVSTETLGLPDGDDATVDIINLKAHPELIGSLYLSTGILPAYHMNKEHWISVILQDVEAEMIWQLLDDSFELTTK